MLGVQWRRHPISWRIVILRRNMVRFLAAQHAIYVNDFQRAADFSRNLDNIEYAVVYNTRMLSEFLSGNMPMDAKLMRDEKKRGGSTDIRCLFG